MLQTCDIDDIESIVSTVTSGGWQIFLSKTYHSKSQPFPGGQSDGSCDRWDGGHTGSGEPTGGTFSADTKKGHH